MRAPETLSVPRSTLAEVRRALAVATDAAASIVALCDREPENEATAALLFAVAACIERQERAVESAQSAVLAALV